MENNVLIVGGELRNRGAQAMTFLVVSVVKKYMPELQPVVVSYFDAPQPLASKVKGLRTRADFNNLSFKIIWDAFDCIDGIETLLAGNNGIALAKHAAKCAAYAHEVALLKDTIKHTALCLDISGFEFGAQWGYVNCMKYLKRLQIMRQYGVSTYILPQSFGPFVFDDTTHTDLIAKTALDILPYPRMVFAREQQGFDDILSLCPSVNGFLGEDIVLQGPSIDCEQIFVNSKTIPSTPMIQTVGNVGIVPNARSFDHGDQIQILALYQLIISVLRDKGYHVYIIMHSEDDKTCCRQLKDMFLNDERILLMDEERYCFQYESLFKRCDFLIASRFHAIVHAYRCGVPCVALGWSTKYAELLIRFNQERFIHDIRKLDKDTILSIILSIDELTVAYEEESLVIAQKMNEIQSRPNALEYVLDDYKETHSLC